MPIPTYTPGYPPDGSSLGQTKAVIRANLDGTFQTLGVDHANNNGVGGPAGYHTVIHSVPQTAVNTVATYTQLYTGVPGTLVNNGGPTTAIPPDGQPQWFSLTPNGSIYQLTGAVKSVKGYAWMGGMLVQWNTIDLSSTWPATATSVNFNVTFPNACLAVFTNLISLSGTGSLSTGDVFIQKGSLLPGSFTYRNNISSGASTSGFSWVAIGW